MFRLGLHDRRQPQYPVLEGTSAHDASGLATARGVLGQPLAPIEAAANLNAGLPFDASQLTFISKSSQVTRVRGPGVGSWLHRRPKFQICAAIALAVHTGLWR